MKKALSLILALVLCLSLCACGTDSVNPTESHTENNNNGKVNTDTEELAMYYGEWKEYLLPEHSHHGIATIIIEEAGVCYLDSVKYEWKHEQDCLTIWEGDVSIGYLRLIVESNGDIYLDCGIDGGGEGLSYKIGFRYEEDNTTNTEQGETSSTTDSFNETVESNTEIVGEWKAVKNNQIVVFYKDGTGEWDGSDLTWKYDSELNCYTIAVSTIYTTNIGTENELEYITLSDIKFYSSDDYEMALEAELQARNKEVAQKAEGMTKLEFGTSIDVGEDELAIIFTGVSWEDSVISINFDITNNGSADVWSPRPWMGEANGFCYTDIGKTGLFVGIPALDIIKAGETLSASFVGKLSGTGDIQKTLEIYGKVIGIFYFKQNGITYYVDLGEHIK